VQQRTKETEYEDLRKAYQQQWGEGGREDA